MARPPCPSTLCVRSQYRNGEVRLFDAGPYLTKGVFCRLADPTLFRQAFIALDTVCWPGDLDIAPETLYDRSVPLAAAVGGGGSEGTQAASRPTTPG